LGTGADVGEGEMHGEENNAGGVPDGVMEASGPEFPKNERH
jgi:hypothetical protein